MYSVTGAICILLSLGVLRTEYREYICILYIYYSPRAEMPAGLPTRVVPAAHLWEENRMDRWIAPLPDV